MPQSRGKGITFGTRIENPLGPPTRSRTRSGVEVARELHGRLLIRYIVPRQLGEFDRGSTVQCYTTPTPYSPEEAVAYLVLPDPGTPRDYAYLLDPSRVPEIQGRSGLRRRGVFSTSCREAFLKMLLWFQVHRGRTGP
jgi:hypothetical protein